MTAPRRAVLKVLGESGVPLTVAEIHARVGQRRVNIVSVYRTVNLLAAEGLLCATDSPHGGQRYELGEQFIGHHHHLICQSCGQIEKFEGCPLTDEVLARLNQRVRHSRLFRVTDHEIRLLGLCGKCNP